MEDYPHPGSREGKLLAKEWGKGRLNRVQTQYMIDMVESNRSGRKTGEGSERWRAPREAYVKDERDRLAKGDLADRQTAKTTWRPITDEVHDSAREDVMAALKNKNLARIPSSNDVLRTLSASSSSLSDAAGGLNQVKPPRLAGGLPPPDFLKNMMRLVR